MSEHTSTKSPDTRIDAQSIFDVTESQEGSHPEPDSLWLEAILEIASSVMDYRKYLMAYEVFYSFDGSAQEYAEQWGQDPGHVRACVREFRVYAHVIQRALKASALGATGIIDDLIDCLPDQDRVGGYRRRIAEAIRDWGEAGQPYRMATVEFVAARTGDSHNTVRQRLPEVFELMFLAHRVIGSNAHSAYGLEGTVITERRLHSTPSRQGMRTA